MSEFTASPTMETNGPAPDFGTKGPVIAVFCGASKGDSPAHMEAARSLAKALHKNNCSLVYGAGTEGIMGEVAKTLVSLSGTPSVVHGIIPRPLAKLERKSDPAGRKATYGTVEVVKNMHIRKSRMGEEVKKGKDGSGFIALSGGFGTMEELMEVVTWNQLGIHDKGIVVFNVDGYFDGIVQWINKAVKDKFITPANKGILVEALTAEDCMAELKNYQLSEGRLNLNWDEK